MMRTFGRLTLVVVVLTVPGLQERAAAQSAKPFSLDVTFNVPAGYPPPAPGIYSDDKGMYADRSDSGGRTPNVYSDGSNFQFDLLGSPERSLCVNFDQPTTALSTMAPSSFCSKVQANTLTSVEYGGVSNLGDGASNYFSMVFYWTGMGVDGKSHDYSVAFRNRDGDGAGNALLATRTGNSWTLGTGGSGTSGIGKVSVYLSGKGGGWNVVGDYMLPFQFTATPHDPNLRTRK
jgi:hypothetical protein